MTIKYVCTSTSRPCAFLYAYTIITMWLPYTRQHLFTNILYSVHFMYRMKLTVWVKVLTRGESIELMLRVITQSSFFISLFLYLFVNFIEIYITFSPVAINKLFAQHQIYWKIVRHWHRNILEQNFWWFLLFHSRFHWIVGIVWIVWIAEVCVMWVYYICLCAL